MTLSFAPERIEQWPLERLKPYARNAKTHGADQVAKIAGSMAQFGWTVPVLVSGDGEVIAGHGRILAATQLGLTDAPVIVLDHLTEEQRKAYRLADNKLTELGAWDEALLARELQELLAEDFDLSVVGFSDAELDELLAGDIAEDDARDGEDEIPDTPADPVSQPGDLWLLGPHRLLCGDATVITDLDRLMAGVKADLCFTDSPYNVDYAGGVGAEKSGKGRRLDSQTKCDIGYVRDRHGTDIQPPQP
jgi:ParB-like chromosome segregation protein Spo0J